MGFVKILGSILLNYLAVFCCFRYLTNLIQQLFRVKLKCIISHLDYFVLIFGLCNFDLIAFFILCTT